MADADEMPAQSLTPLTIHAYFRKAYQNLVRAGDPAEAMGPVVFGADRNCAAFRLEVEQERIVRADYRCTTCVTLVALCEHLSELVLGMPVEDALRMDAGVLLHHHPEVPEERRDRAMLAIDALRSAIQWRIQRS